MMKNKLKIIVILQAIVIVLLFWFLVVNSQDEYEAYQEEQEEEIESESHVIEKDGFNSILLSPEVQQNSGISSVALKSSSYEGTLNTYGKIVSLDALFTDKARYDQLKIELNLAKSGINHLQEKYQSLKALNDDDKNIADHVVRDALAKLNAEKANVQALNAQLSTVANQARSKWGAQLAQIVTHRHPPKHLAKLLQRKNVLVQASFPFETPPPAKGSEIDIALLNSKDPIAKAIYVSPSMTTDITNLGKTFYYSAQADALRVGMRVQVLSAEMQSNVAEGVIIPNNAVVWHGGKPWVYLKQTEDTFVRTPVSIDTELENGWFSTDLDANVEVVDSGAQLLLSEEFKFLIKNENDD